MFMDFVIIFIVICLFLYVMYLNTRSSLSRPNKRHYPYNDEYSKKLRTN